MCEADRIIDGKLVCAMEESAASCPHTKRYYYYGVCEDCGAIRESAASGGERPGDETNKNVRCLAKHYSHGDGSKCVYYSEKDPVASNTGKPCEHNIQATLNYQKRIAELQNEIESQKHCYRLLEEHRASLESSLEGMRKRNEAQTEMIEWQDTLLDKYPAIGDQLFICEQKLKTVEDKLAAVTKEKDDLQKDLTTLMNTGELH